MYPVQENGVCVVCTVVQDVCGVQKEGVYVASSGENSVCTVVCVECRRRMCPHSLLQQH